ncbi:13598_t:CDS:2, partial [Acaulospora colombiana]
MSLIVPGIAPFLDFTGLLMFVEKISIYMIAGATLYFLRTTNTRDIEYNADLPAYETIFNEILTARDVRFTSELADRDARLDEIEEVLRTYRFLNECKIEPFERKIDQYLRCLNTITDNEKDKRKERAEILLRAYREASHSPSHKTNAGAQGTGSSNRSKKSEKMGKGTFAQAGNMGTITGSLVVGSKRDREKDEINYFFQSPSERESSNLFKKLRKSDEQDISNEKDDEIETTKSPSASCVHESQDINKNVKSDAKEDTDIDAGQIAMSSSFYQTTDNIGVVMNDKNLMNEIHNEPETSNNDNNDYNEKLDDEEIKFDLANITKELQKEPTVEWKVGSINVTQRFWQYQIEMLKKADKGGLTYENIYEI